MTAERAGLLQSRTLRVAGAVVALVILAWLVRRVAADWNSVAAYPWKFHVGYLVASLISIELGFAIMARAWRSVLRAIGVRWPYARAYWVFYLSNLGRYIPGALWQMGAAAIMARHIGVSARDIVVSMIVHLLYFLPMGAALALASGTFPPPFDTAGIRFLAWAAALACIATAVWPHLLLRAFSPVATRLGMDPERWKLETSRRVGILVQTMGAWLCLSLGFSLLVLAVTPVEVSMVWGLARVYMVSHILGLVVLLAPAGLGVREGVMVLLLSPLVGAGPAAGLALLSRLWFTLAELLAVGAAALCLRHDRAALNSGDTQVAGE